MRGHGDTLSVGRRRDHHTFNTNARPHVQATALATNLAIKSPCSAAPRGWSCTPRRPLDQSRRTRGRTSVVACPCASCRTAASYCAFSRSTCASISARGTKLGARWSTSQYVRHFVSGPRRPRATARATRADADMSNWGRRAHLRARDYVLVLHVEATGLETCGSGDGGGGGVTVQLIHSHPQCAAVTSAAA